MNKIVINNCYGGYGVSDTVVTYIMKKLSKSKLEALEADYYKEIEEVHDGNFNNWTFLEHVQYHISEDMARHDPLLVEAVENCAEPHGFCANLRICEIKGNRYIIKEYDGLESISEPDDIKWITI